jgi:toxin FitB
MGTRRQTHESPLTEIELGLALMMPPGQRQADLAQAAHATFDSELQGSSLPFNKATASHCAHTVATGARTRMGRPISTEDAHIAAIA